MWVIVEKGHPGREDLVLRALEKNGTHTLPEKFGVAYETSLEAYRLTSAFHSLCCYSA